MVARLRRSSLALPALLLALAASRAGAQTDRSIVVSVGRASSADGSGTALALQAVPFAKHLNSTYTIGAGLSAWYASTPVRPTLPHERRRMLGVGPMVELNVHPIWHGPWLVATAAAQYAHVSNPDVPQTLLGAAKTLRLIPSEGDLHGGSESSLAGSWSLGVRQVFSGTTILSLDYSRAYHALTTDRAARSLGRVSLGVGVVY